MQKNLFSTGRPAGSGVPTLIFRIMRITVVLMLACIHLYATGYSQEAKITFSLKDVKLSEIFNIIQQRSDYQFLYNDEDLSTVPPVSLAVYDATVPEILRICFKGSPLDYKIVKKTVVVLLKPHQDPQENIPVPVPEHTIRGLVRDKSGGPLVGVSVSLSGSATGTVTDTRGRYSLTLPDTEGTIVFSFIGYQKQEVEVAGRSEIDIVLTESVSSLDQLVVVGYGSVKKEDLTSAISVIDDKAIRDRPLATLSEAFAGQLSGVRAQSTTGIPGSELQIRIRGVNTINGNSSPLYVIDGVPRDDMTGISPNDISSIQILKDASATAIYGARGANGVVLIETKQGKGRPSLNFDVYYGFQDPEKFVGMMNLNQWRAYNIWHRNVDWLRRGGSMKDPMSARPDNLKIPDEWLDPNLKGTDWQKAITVVAPMTSYELSASMKGDAGSLYMSGGYLDQDGIIYNTYYKRVNFRVNGILNVSDHIKLGLNLAPSFENSDARQSQGKELVIHHALTESPLVGLHQATRDWGFPTGLGNVYPNPLEQLKYTIDNTRRNTITSGVWAEIEFTKGLKFKTLYSRDYRQVDYEFFQPGNVTYNNGFVTMGNSNSQAWNNWSIQNTLVYDRAFGANHFNFLVGQAADDHRYFRLRATASGWPNELIPTLNVATTPTLASTDKNRYKSVSFFSRVSYNYGEKYLLNASVRRDGSSRFGSNNKWGVFPAVSAGWKINEESFLKPVQWISLLKVRAAWGSAGNDRIGNYDYMARLSINNASWGGAVVPGLVPSNIENPDLKWEATQTTDLGLDFSGFNNRLQISVDYYLNKTKNLLFNVPIPTTTGFSSFRTNLGEVQNTGWEFDITTVNTSGKLRWSTSVNLSTNRNKVINMGDIDQFTSSSWDAQFITRVGGPVAQYYVYRTNGLLSASDFDQNGKALVPILSGQEIGNVKYVDQNGDGKITTEDYRPYGNNIPDLIYGMTNRLEWRNFAFSVLFQGQLGGDVLFLGQRQMDNGGTNNNTFARWVHAWKPDYEALYGSGENPIPDIPGVDMSWDGKTPNIFGKWGDNNSDLRIYDATFVRIRNIQLNYTVPASALPRLKVLKGASFYISVDNLKTFDNYPGVTPETNSFGNSTTQPGVDYSTYPLSKKYTIGAHLTF
jgi:TonB-linked SusC/RagA family outer membrane protein